MINLGANLVLASLILATAYADEICKKDILVQKISGPQWGVFKELKAGETNPMIKRLVLKALNGKSEEITVEKSYPGQIVPNSNFKFFAEACLSIYGWKSIEESGFTIFDHADGSHISVSSADGLRLSKDRKWALISRCYSSDKTPSNYEQCYSDPLLQYFSLKNGKRELAAIITSSDVLGKLRPKAKSKEILETLSYTIRIYPELSRDDIFQVNFRGHYVDNPNNDTNSPLGTVVFKFCRDDAKVKVCPSLEP